MEAHKDMLVVTSDGELADRIRAFLRDTKLNCSFIEDSAQLGAVFGGPWPEIALVDGDIGIDAAIAACEVLRKIAGRDRLGILVLISKLDDDSVNAMLQAGADDFLGRHIKPISFRARIEANLSRINAIKTLAHKVHDSEVLIDVTSTLVGSPNILVNLHNVARLIADELTVDRCSIVLVRPQGDFGLVVTSSDDPEVRSLAINLKRYPEIAHAAKHGTPLIIEDVEGSQVVEEVLPSLKKAGVSSAALFPIVRQGETLGVIFLRFLGRRQKFDNREIIFCQTVANAASIALRNAEILELLKAKTREMEKVQSEVQNQIRSLKRYEQFFLSGLDGNVVLEQSGNVVFANPVALEMLGVSAGDIQGRPFFDFLVKGERESFDMLLDEFVRGETSSHVDFHVTKSSGEELVLMVSAGSLFGEEGLMLLTMRDITEERLMEQRLMEARERLVQGEKRAAMAELAGAAAHELNQPLTSIMTSIAMLMRLMDNKDKVASILSTMEGESERMATIIRRLTRITNYTTKNYVGSAKIIDLDTACDDDARETILEDDRPTLALDDTEDLTETGNWDVPQQLLDNPGWGDQEDTEEARDTEEVDPADETGNSGTAEDEGEQEKH